MARGNKPTELKVIQGGIVDAVEPPRTLPKDAKADWDIITADLSQRKLLTEATLGVVEVYCTALWQVRECTKVIEQLGMFVKGQNGVPKANPATSMMQKAQETVNRLSVELGLTPSARSRRGLSGPTGEDEDEAEGQGV